VVDPSGQIGSHQPLTLDVGATAPSRVSVPVNLPDGDPFGQLTGYSQATLNPVIIDSARMNASAFAAVLGSLVSGERALAAEHRAGERRLTEGVPGAADPLTGLATRSDWEDRLVREEAFCAEFGESAATIVIDLHELKRRNELRGYSAGDEQLRAAGHLVRASIAHHYAARLSGDRIGVLLVGVDESGLSETEVALRHKFAESEIATAMGVGRRHHDKGLSGALAEAEDQLLQAHSARTAPTADASEAAALLQAIENGSIKAYFQPIVDLRTGAVVAIEALARWQSRDGVREPDQFLHQMQQAGLLGPLFERILEDGLDNLAEFRHSMPNLGLAVNFEFDSKLDGSFHRIIGDMLTKHNVPGDALSIEFSERQTFDLPASVRKELETVSEMGVRLMLDDFGTGFASLETLTSLPISGVKLDRRFTGQVVNGDREPVVVKAMIALAAEAGLTVIAEGIETQVQCDRLVRLGCRLGQGYLFALPQPAESLSAVLSAPLVSTF
jgi:diguanylate cyclase (GGDEF)-like protein